MSLPSVSPSKLEALLQERRGLLIRLAQIEETLKHRSLDPPLPYQALKAAPKARQVWRALMKDLGTKEIALEMGITPRGVKFHIARLLKITGCKSRNELYRYTLHNKHNFNLNLDLDLYLNSDSNSNPPGGNKS